MAVWDVSQRLVLSGMWEIPVGRGKWLGTRWNKSLDAVLGRWQFNGIAAFQTGSPLALSATQGTRPDRAPPGGEVHRTDVRIV